MSRRAWWMGLLGVSLALVGFWGAWVPHRAAALVLSGWDLAEFVKFVPGAHATRELFYLPAWCGGAVLAILAGQRANTSSSPQISESPPPSAPAFSFRHLVLLGIALALMVAILPPYPDLLRGYQSAEFRWQFALGIGGALMVLVTWSLASRWPARTIGRMLVALALAGAVLAVWQFLKVRGTIEVIYDASLGWGWGLGMFLIGWGLVALVGASTSLTDFRNLSPKRAQVTMSGHHRRPGRPLG